MGGLYNMVLGDGGEWDRRTVLLGILGDPDVGRYRDCWVEKDEAGEPIIAIYTRNGGGNREYCMPDFSDHPLYLRDADDDFDSTYATIYFGVPTIHREQMLGVARDEPVDTSARWLDLIEALKVAAGATRED